MVDSSDFEAFFDQERKKASRVLPPSSRLGASQAPSRHLFFAREAEEEEEADSSSEVDIQLTLRGEATLAVASAF